mgnify:CR=1 FL=1|jgi:hypothetical protein
MKLHNLVTNITKAQAVQYYSSDDKNVVAYYDGEYYNVDNFGVFDESVLKGDNKCTL